LLAARSSKGSFGAGSNGNGLTFSFPGNVQPFSDARNGLNAQPVPQRPDPVAESLSTLLAPKADNREEQSVITRQENQPQETEGDFMRNISILLALFIVGMIVAAVISQMVH
jgi:hypothetical protein